MLSSERERETTVYANYYVSVIMHGKRLTLEVGNRDDPGSGIIEEERHLMMDATVEHVV